MRREQERERWWKRWWRSWRGGRDAAAAAELYIHICIIYLYYIIYILPPKSIITISESVSLF